MPREPPHAKVIVGCAQLAPRFGELAVNRAASIAAIRAGMEDGAELVVLPELCITGYGIADAGQAQAMAEPIDGPTVRAWCEIASRLDMVVVGGICLDDGDWVSNAAVVIDGHGLRCLYRKTHLWGPQKSIFRPGTKAPPVVETRVGRIGVAICFDSFFPEVMRGLAVGGADLIAVPMNNASQATPAQPVPIEVTLAMATARVNRVYVAQATDRLGAEGTNDLQASVIAGPDGSVIAGPVSDVAVLVAACEIARARDKSLGDRNDVLADRRLELYGGVHRRGPGSHRSSRAASLR